MRASGIYGDAPGNDNLSLNGIEYKKGNKVRLRLGKRRSDASDMLIDGRIATIETIYTDYDGEAYFAVTIDDDPGQQMQRELNIYRYFLLDEVEIIQE